MATLAPVLLLSLSGVLLALNLWAAKRFAPAGPQRNDRQALRRANRRSLPWLAATLLLLGGLVYLSQWDRLGACSAASLGIGLLTIAGCSDLSRLGLATRGRVGSTMTVAILATSMIPSLAGDQGLLLGLNTQLLSLLVLLAAGLTIWGLSNWARRAGLCTAMLALLLIAASAALWWTRIDPQTVEPDPVVAALHELSPDVLLATRADALARIEAPEPGLFGWSSKPTAAIEMLRLDAGPSPDLTNANAAFRMYMDGYVLERITINEVEDLEGPVGPPASRAGAEALGLFTADDYAAVRKQVARKLLLESASPFDPLTAGVVLYAYLAAEQVSKQELEAVLSSALRQLPVPGERRTLEALIRLDTLFSRIGRPELREQLIPLARESLQAVWAGYAPNGEAHFADSADTLESAPEDGAFSFGLLWDLPASSSTAVLAMQRFGLTDEVDLLGLEKYFERHSVIDANGDFDPTAVTALSLVRSWPAYTQQLSAPHQLTRAELAQQQRRLLAWSASPKSAPHPSSLSDLRLLLSVIVVGGLGIRITLRAPLAQAP